MQYVQVRDIEGRWCKVDINTRLIVSTATTPHKSVKRLRPKQWAMDHQTGRVEILVDLSRKMK